MKEEKEPLFEVRELSYSYDNHVDVLHEINLKIRQGEKIAVIGANGAGKSTFFLTLNGVLKPSKGEIIYRGQVMIQKNRNLFRKNVGIVFQDADHQIIASTVKAEVSFGPMNLKLPKEEVVKRVDQALYYMNLTQFRERPPHYLSGGEKKRVSIADIIAMEPEVIIFDEPTASLDPLNTKMLEEVIDRLSTEGKTLLISTHDVDFVYRFADRVLVFYEGKIIADGTPTSVFEDAGTLQKANLKKPILLDVVNIMKEKGYFANLQMKECYPKTMEEFKDQISNML